jgi:hypothetical protein
MKIAYLHFRASNAGPFQTVSVPVREKLLWWQARGLQYTSSGYGSRIPSRYLVQWAGRWRRVYVTQWSNAGSAWVRIGGEKVSVQLEGGAL